ncbi:MAG: putative enzyme of poly-gamma-glutamate biosynthesis (capsule formation)-like protein [Subtercola sp.]|nr:putative enzyme of poly-gamma-glutamate biosynthesis (capsule formation)-like protein [Subtercola sp.]
MSTQNVSFAAIGDLSFHDGASLARLAAVAADLAAADIAFGQLEGPLSAEGTYQRSPGAYRPENDAPSPDQAATALAASGIDVVGIAGAHTLDRSREGLAATRAVLESQNLTPIGAGPDAAVARAPYTVTVNGLTVAVLAYSSFVQRRNEATSPRTTPDRGGNTNARPGIAPMRALTLYTQLDWQAGTAARVITIPDEADLKAVEADVRAAKETADVVVVSFRWGMPQGDVGAIADYQYEVGRRAVDAGASLVFGHGSSLVQAIELYRGATICYGIGGFSFRPRGEDDPLPDHRPTPDTRWTAVLRAELTAEGAKVALLPYAFGADGIPHPVTEGSPEFAEYHAFLQRSSVAPSTAKNAWEIHYLPVVENSLALRYTGYVGTNASFEPIALPEMIADPILAHRGH